MSSDLDSLRELVNERFDGLERTLTARLEAVDQRREHGDRSLAQRTEFIETRVGGVTREIGALDAKIERIETDVNKALKIHKEELQNFLSKEISKLVGALSDRAEEQKKDKARISKIEMKLNNIRWGAIGVGIGAGLTSGGLVALLTGALGIG